MKFISAILTAIIITVSATALAFADTEETISAYIDVDSSQKIISVNGTSTGKSKSVQIYLLRDGKSISDIKNTVNMLNEVSYMGQAQKDVNGLFHDEFKYSGNAGNYKLCLKSGNVYKEYAVDTTKTTGGSQLYRLKQLPTSYGALDAQTVKERYEAARAELGDEMPVVLSATPVGAREIFVSKDADKSIANGSINTPFSSVADAINSLNGAYTDTVIYLRGGVYSYSDFGALKNIVSDEKMPLYISAYNNEKVTFNGGNVIKGDLFKNISDEKALETLNPDARKKVMSINLKKLGITDYGTFTTDSIPTLSVDGEDYDAARWPNADTTSMREYLGDDGENGVIDSGPITTGVGSVAGPRRDVGKYGEKGFEICVENIRPFSWKNTDNIWMYGSFYQEWTKDRVRIKSLNADKRSVRTYTGQSWGAIYDTGNKFYYYNIFEELDCPGEWFLDYDTGMLYVYPSADLKGKDVILSSSADGIAELSNCINVVINGINFEKAGKSAITMQNCEGVVVQNCVIDSCGSNGINIKGNSKYCGVTQCKILNCTGDAFSVSMSTDIIKSLTPQRNFIQNSYVYNCRAVRVHGVGNIASHNVVSNAVGTAMYINQGCENVYEYNEVYSSPREISDAGGIYVNGNNFAARGNHVRFNYIHNTHEERTQYTGIYLDDMLSGNFVYGNIVEDAIIFYNGGSENAIVGNIIKNPMQYNSETGTNSKYHGVTDTRGYMINDRRWKSGALEMGSFTTYLKSDYYKSDVWKNRYPSLYDFSVKMLTRINEYKQNGEMLSNINVRLSDGEVLDSSVNVTYPSEWDAKSGRFDTTNTITDLNTYLRAPKYAYVANNFSINANTKTGIYISDIGSRTAVAENNVKVETKDNPFASKGYSSEQAYDTVRGYIRKFDSIPYENIGVIIGAKSWNDYVKLGDTNAISPVNGSTVHDFSGGISFIWTSVLGAGKYTLEIARDSSFKNIVYSKTQYGMDCTVKDSGIFADNTQYWWRVKLITMSDNVKQEVKVSDTYTFNTNSSEMEVIRSENKINICNAVLNVNGEKSQLCGVPYNISNDVMNTLVYAAVYSNNELVDIKQFNISVPANEFGEKFEIEFNKKSDRAAFFIWENNTSINPISRAVKISKEG